jgi:prepilin-type N-terminal cleavage/methylation domain-containing protein
MNIVLLSNIKRRGFTLIEILVYMAVLCIAVVAMITTFLSYRTVLLRNEVERAVSHNAQVVLERLTRDIHEATSVDTSISGQITLETAGSATTSVYTLSGDTITLMVNGKNLGNLTEDDVSVTAFTHTAYQNVTGEIPTTLVRVALSLESVNAVATTIKTYYTSAVLRGMYE